MTGTTPHDPRADRFAGLLRVLRVEGIVIAVLCVAAVAVPAEGVAEVLGVLVLTGVTASAPLRVAWLAQRWWRNGDRLYGALAALLVTLPAVGFVLSVLM